MSEIATIQIRKGTAAQWASANPILANGEMGFVTDNGLFKIGDGSTAFTNLPYSYSKIPDATNTSKGLATAAQVAQINTNKTNITNLSTTVGNHTTAITNLGNTVNGHTTDITTLSRALPKVNCVRLSLAPSGEEVEIYQGNVSEVLYCAVDGEPIDPSILGGYKIKLDSGSRVAVDFIFKNSHHNNIVPAKAFYDLGFTNSTNAVLILPDYITKIESEALKITEFAIVLSYAIEPPEFADAPGNVAKVLVPHLLLTEYAAAAIWNAIPTDNIQGNL